MTGEEIREEQIRELITEAVSRLRPLSLSPSLLAATPVPPRRLSLSMSPIAGPISSLVLSPPLALLPPSLPPSLVSLPHAISSPSSFRLSRCACFWRHASINV